MSKMPRSNAAKTLKRVMQATNLGHLNIVLLLRRRRWLVGEHGARAGVEVLGGGLCEEGAWLDPIDCVSTIALLCLLKTDVGGGGWLTS